MSDTLDIYAGCPATKHHLWRLVGEWDVWTSSHTSQCRPPRKESTLAVYRCAHCGAQRRTEEPPR